MPGSYDGESLFYDHESNHQINPEWEVTDTPKSDNTAETQAPAKMTAFSMYEHFKAHTNYASIDGSLHLYNHVKKCYFPLDQRTLEDYLLRTYYKDAAQTGSLRIIKTCAELIMRIYIPDQSSAEKNLYMCFRTGYIPLAEIKYASFRSYAKSDPCTFGVYPTYTVDADISEISATWNELKTLPTPMMDNFVYEIAGGNPKIITRIWQMIGYLLTPDMRGKCFFLLQGIPNSGKSVLGNFLSQLLPDHRIASLDIDQLGKRHATSALVNKSINISMDLPNKLLSPLAIRNIKLMTGNDDITIEHRNGKMEKYRGSCKFLFATNHPLTLNGTDSGFEGRIVCIPFYNEITPERRNYNLREDLLREKNYIVAKAIAYYRDLCFDNYEFSGSELEICKPDIRYLPTEAEDQDANLCWFIENRCELVPVEYGGVHTENLYSAYVSYCKDINETPIDNIASFSRRLMRCYGNQITKKKWRDKESQENRWGFRGLLLNPMTFVSSDGIYNV